MELSRVKATELNFWQIPKILDSLAKNALKPILHMGLNLSTVIDKKPRQFE